MPPFTYVHFADLFQQSHRIWEEVEQLNILEMEGRKKKSHFLSVVYLYFSHRAAGVQQLAVIFFFSFTIFNPQPCPVPALIIP